MFEYYEGMAFYDTRGIILADAVDPQRRGISIAHRPYFKQARKGIPDFGTMVASMATGNPVFVISSPVVSHEGEFLGGFIGVIMADYLMKYISTVELGDTGYAFMIDPSGMIIAHPKEEYMLNRNLGISPGLNRFWPKCVQTTPVIWNYSWTAGKKS